MSDMSLDEPAFPCQESDSEGHIHCIDRGMTLRDYFAAKAMQSHCVGLPPGLAASRSYEYADAMLEVRNT